MTDTTHCFARLQDARNLPSLPQLLVQIIEINEQEDVDIKKLVKIIAQDPSISAKVLRLVNSAYFNLQGKFTSLERAVLYLGAETIKNVAITASIHHVFTGVKRRGLFPIDHFWWTSFSCAIYAKRIAQQLHYGNIEEAYMAGLLHNLGKLLLWLNFPKEYAAILSFPEQLTNECEAEKQQIGITHCDAGAWLITHWKLNSFMADAVLYHHEPIARIKHSFPLVKITCLAHKLSKMQDEEPDAIIAIGRELLDLDSTQMKAIISGAREEIECIATSLDLVQRPPNGNNAVQETPLDKHSLHLVTKVQESSLLTCFLEDLIRAGDRDSILLAAEQALHTLLEIDTILFFLKDGPSETLLGCTSSSNRYQELVRDMVLPDAISASLLARSIDEQKIITPQSPSSPHEKTLADSQLINLIGRNGLVYVPMAAGKVPIGAIALGLQETKLNGDARLLRLVANQTALALHLLDIREKQARVIEEERLAAISLTAAKIAHEVNNPLAIIKNYFKLFELKFTHSSTLKEDLKVLNGEIGRISDIVQQLTTFSQADGKEPEPVDINSLLTGIIRILSRSILHDTGVKVHFTSDPYLPTVISHEDKIKQVIINLVKNAAEALPDGGNIFVETHLRETAGDQQVTEQPEPCKPCVEIIIRDDGPGIAEDIAGTLFDPFTSTKGTGNSGLGLAIVRNIMTKLKGTVSCHSIKNEGTSFTITLPVDGF